VTAPVENRRGLARGSELAGTARATAADPSSFNEEGVPLLTVAELRKRLEELENAGHGYESWQVCMAAEDPYDPILDDIEYRVCGVDDPSDYRHEHPGLLVLHVELTHAGRGLPGEADRVRALLKRCRAQQIAEMQASYPFG
jgi:hypothetical protein